MGYGLEVVSWVVVVLSMIGFRSWLADAPTPSP